MKIMFKYFFQFFIASLFVLSSCADLKNETIHELMESNEFRKGVYKEIFKDEKYLIEFTESMNRSQGSNLTCVLGVPSFRMLSSNLGNDSSIYDDVKIIKEILNNIKHKESGDSMNCILTYNEIFSNGHLKSYTLKHTCGKGESKVK